MPTGQQFFPSLLLQFQHYSPRHLSKNGQKIGEIVEILGNLIFFSVNWSYLFVKNCIYHINKPEQEMFPR